MDLGKLDMDAACGGRGHDYRRRTKLSLAFKYRIYCGLAHAHRQQADAVAALLPQTTLAIEVAPVEHHVSVDSMLPCHTRDRCSRQHRLLHDVALFGNVLFGGDGDNLRHRIARGAASPDQFPTMLPSKNCSAKGWRPLFSCCTSL